MTTEEERFGSQGEGDEPSTSNLVQDLSMFAEDGIMNPDHPLLARAQAALKKQLVEARTTFEEQLRECKEELKV